MSPRAKARSELAVLVACHAFLVAIPARAVVRLWLPEEAGPLTPSRPGSPHLGTLQVGAEVCAAWDLGRLLEQRALARAWVVLEVVRDGMRVPIALRTGVCALVTEVCADTSLPGRIFRARARAFPAAFAAATLVAGLPSLFGLWLDPAHLFTDEELALSREAIAHAQEETAKP